MLKCCCEPKHQEFKFCFKLNCQGGTADLITLWEADPNLCNPNGTLIITYKDGCDLPLEVFLNDKGPSDPLDFVIQKGQTHAITLSKLRKVSVKCRACVHPPKGKCCGSVCISLNYT